MPTTDTECARCTRYGQCPLQARTRSWATDGRTAVLDGSANRYGAQRATVGVMD